MTDRTLILGAAIGLISAFICPLALGSSWFFGPTLLAEAPPGLRTMTLVPGVIGPVALVAALELRPLPRAVVAVLGGGAGLIVLVGTIEALSAGQAAGLEQVFTHGSVAAPGIAAVALFSLVMAGAFTGLALARHHPEVGARVVGLTGAALLALHLVPLGERTPLSIVLDRVAWKTAWPIPASLIVTAAFAVVCSAQLFDGPLREGRGRRWSLGLAKAIGVGAVLVLPVALVADAAARSPEILAFTTTVQAKFTGTWIALYALAIGGVLGLVGLSRAAADEAGDPDAR